MKVLNILFTGLALLCHFTTLSSQCRCTVEQLNQLIDTTDFVDPIVGLYVLSSENIKVNDKNEVLRSTSQNLSSWIIKPQDDHFVVCHTEFTSYQNFNARIFKLDDGSYLYKSVLSTKEIVLSYMHLTDEGLNYTVQIPEKAYMKYYKLDQPDGFIKLWEFNWRKIDVSENYKEIIANLDLDTNPVKEDIPTRVLTSKSLQKSLKKVSNIAGFEYIDQSVFNEKFMITKVYTMYPGVYTVCGHFKDEDTLFEIDIDKETLDPYSIRPLYATNRDKLNELSKYFKRMQTSKARSQGI